ncbi:hypothetical protein HPP92_006675 [Vanilla planifolia]|uniref:Uncharacterized protein n=1 Tax=Vanilla planifolia TaxID=51239 RepID=A0A835RB87_VANPL|nr:hypothetical protein HPP92_006675 [Vanilla planifolia]
MEQKKPVLHLLMILLFLSCHFSLAATARISKSLGSTNQAATDEADQVGNVEESIEEKFVEGRMEYESPDYPGTGPNNRHVPRAPGRH